MKLCARCHRPHAGPLRTCPKCLAWFKACKRAQLAAGLCGFVGCRASALAPLKTCARHRELTRVYNAAKKRRPLPSLNDYDSVL